MHEHKTPDTSETLGCFAVTVIADEVEAFCASLALPPSPVPLTFDMSFLAREEIALALRQNLPRDGIVIHRAQRFRAHAPLEVGRAYKLQLLRHGVRPHEPVIHGRMHDAQGALVHEFWATLMLRSRDEEPA
jgi:hypothetical protein